MYGAESMSVCACARVPVSNGRLADERPKHQRKGARILHALGLAGIDRVSNSSAVLPHQHEGAWVPKRRVVLGQRRPKILAHPPVLDRVHAPVKRGCHQRVPALKRQHFCCMVCSLLGPRRGVALLPLLLSTSLPLLVACPRFPSTVRVFAFLVCPAQ